MRLERATFSIISSAFFLDHSRIRGMDPLFVFFLGAICGSPLSKVAVVLDKETC